VAPGVVLRVARGAIGQRIDPVEEPADDTGNGAGNGTGTGDGRPES